MLYDQQEAQVTGFSALAISAEIYTEDMHKNVSVSDISDFLSQMTDQQLLKFNLDYLDDCQNEQLLTYLVEQENQQALEIEDHCSRTDLGFEIEIDCKQFLAYFKETRSYLLFKE